MAGRELEPVAAAQGPVRPGCVVVNQVFGQYPPQVILIDDQQPVEELPAKGADHPLADRVRPGRLRRAGENPDAVRSEHGIEGLSERSLIRNLTEAARWPRCIRKLRAA